MSHAATAWAYAAQIRSAGRKFVLVALADFADEAWSCFPGQERLADMTANHVEASLCFANVVPRSDEAEVMRGHGHGEPVPKPAE